MKKIYAKLEKSINNKGITLIALVVTIIILLILAGVTISMLTGDNEILGQAMKAKTKTEIAEEKEKVELAVAQAFMNSENRDIQQDILEEELLNEGLDGRLIEQDKFIYIGKKANYRISIEGVVSIIEYKGIIYGNTKSLLPDGYQQLEYLESTGTQYINSGVRSTNEIECSMDCMLLEESNGEGFIGYNRRSFANNWSYIRHYSYDIVDYGEKRIIVSKKTKLNQRYKIYFGNGYLSIPGAQIDEKGNKTTSIPNSDIYLFGSYFDSTSVLSRKMRIYELTFSENNNIIAHFIPVLDSNNRACMYETVTNQAFYNQGKGEFLYGLKSYNCVGDRDDNGKYEIPITFSTPNEEQTINIVLDQPLRMLDDNADYIDLVNKKVVRNIGVNSINGELYLLDKPIEEIIQIKDIDSNNIISILVGTKVKPSNIE